MNNNELIKEIDKLKKDRNAVVLVHNYQRPEIQEIADFLGDSLELSRKAAETNADIIVFCGVKFMAETAKILSPNKTVLIPRNDAGCPMADMITKEQLVDMKKKYPKAKVVTYVNSTADVKTVSDVCCTSANAVKIVENIDADEIIFTPDKNLAAYCQKFTKKRIIPWQGFCTVHRRFTKKEILSAKQNYPDSVFMVHPECEPDIVEMADEVLSTSGMLRYAKASKNKVFLVGTEEGLIHRLKRENPDKTFYSAGSPKVCVNMKKTKLDDVYKALRKNQYEIALSEEIISKASKALEEMLKYS